MEKAPGFGLGGSVFHNLSTRHGTRTSTQTPGFGVWLVDLAVTSITSCHRQELARALLRLRGSKQCFHPLMARVLGGVGFCDVGSLGFDCSPLSRRHPRAVVGSRETTTSSFLTLKPEDYDLNLLVYSMRLLWGSLGFKEAPIKQPPPTNSRTWGAGFPQIRQCAWGLKLSYWRNPRGIQGVDVFSECIWDPRLLRLSTRGGGGRPVPAAIAWG